MGLHSSGVPARILDLLSIEGGWWRSDEITERLGAKPTTVQKSLYRLAERGQIRKRLRVVAVTQRHFGGRELGTEAEIAEWSA